MKKSKMVKQEKPLTKEEIVHKNTNQAQNTRDRAMVAMSKYLKENKLNPDKDWTKDPVHGPKLLEWMRIIRLFDEKSKALEIRQRVLKKPSKEVLMPKKVEKKVTRYAYIYDYPTLDNGEELSSSQKKIYRQKLKRLLNARMPKERAEKKAFEFLKERLS